MTIASLQVSVSWNNVIRTLETGEVCEYPGKFTAYMRERYPRPAVYRWSVHPVEPGRSQQVYIGEADDLLVRIQRVLTPAKVAKPSDTNGRLKRIFDEQIAAGRHVSLSVLDFSPFELNGALFAADRLSHQYLRRALENICLCMAETEGKELLNKKVEPLGRAKRKKIQEWLKLNPRQTSELLKKAEEMRDTPGRALPSIRG
ncbi:MAG: hypothetical protein ACRD5K_16035 [Candidatus Acidiferrales bacterium]